MNKKTIDSAKIIWDFLKINDSLENSDAIFILGGSSILPVKKASELYKKGLSKYIVFHSTSGTFSNSTWKNSEAKTYYDKLIKLGVPKKAIIWDELTSNTLDEAKMSVKFMKKNGIKPKRIILVDRPVHQRRAFATFIQQNPNIGFINIPSDEAFKPSMSLIMRMIAEIERLALYAKKGDLKKQILPKKVKLALKSIT